MWISVVFSHLFDTLGGVERKCNSEQHWKKWNRNVLGQTTVLILACVYSSFFWLTLWHSCNIFFLSLRGWRKEQSPTPSTGVEKQGFNCKFRRWAFESLLSHFWAMWLWESHLTLLGLSCWYCCWDFYKVWPKVPALQDYYEIQEIKYVRKCFLYSIWSG